MSQMHTSQTTGERCVGGELRQRLPAAINQTNSCIAWLPALVWATLQRLLLLYGLGLLSSCSRCSFPRSTSCTPLPLVHMYTSKYVHMALAVQGPRAPVNCSSHSLLVGFNARCFMVATNAHQSWYSGATRAAWSHLGGHKTTSLHKCGPWQHARDWVAPSIPQCSG